MRPEKQAVVAEIRERVAGSEYCLVVNYQGLTVEKLRNLRTHLRGTKSRLDVVKNAFFRLAAGAAGKTVPDGMLSGAVAVVTGQGEVTLVAKSVLEFSRANAHLQVRGGFLGRDVLSVDDVQAMSAIPPREALLGKLVGTIAAPMTGLVGVMTQKVQSLLYVLKAIEEKKSKA